MTQEPIIYFLVLVIRPACATNSKTWAPALVFLAAGRVEDGGRGPGAGERGVPLLGLTNDNNVLTESPPKVAEYIMSRVGLSYFLIVCKKTSKNILSFARLIELVHCTAAYLTRFIYIDLLEGFALLLTSHLWTFSGLPPKFWLCLL